MSWVVDILVSSLRFRFCFRVSRQHLAWGAKGWGETDFSSNATVKPFLDLRAAFAVSTLTVEPADIDSLTVLSCRLQAQSRMISTLPWKSRFVQLFSPLFWWWPCLHTQKCLPIATTLGQCPFSAFDPEIDLLRYTAVTYHNFYFSVLTWRGRWTLLIPSPMVTS